MIKRIHKNKYQKVYAIDINEWFLEVTKNRFSNLLEWILECKKLDLSNHSLVMVVPMEEKDNYYI